MIIYKFLFRARPLQTSEGFWSQEKKTRKDYGKYKKLMIMQKGISKKEKKEYKSGQLQNLFLQHVVAYLHMYITRISNHTNATHIFIKNQSGNIEIGFLS